MTTKNIQTPEKIDDFLAIADALPTQRKEQLTHIVGGFTGFADNNIVNFGVGALEFLESTAYNVQHQSRIFKELVPLDLSVPEWADSVSYKIYDYSGKGKRVKHNSDVRPMANFEIGKTGYEIYEGGMDYTVSFTELLKSFKMQMPVDATRAKAAGEGYMNHLNEVAIYGELGDAGLINHPSIPQVASGLVNNSAIDPANTAEDVYTKLSDAVNKVILDTFENCIPDTVLVDSNVFQWMSRTKYDALSRITVLQHFLENNPSKDRSVDLKVIPVPNLVDITNPAKTMALIYKRDQTTLLMAHPMPLRFLDPQRVKAHLNYTGIYTYSTLHVRYPKNCLYLTSF